MMCSMPVSLPFLEQIDSLPCHTAAELSLDGLFDGLPAGIPERVMGAQVAMLAPMCAYVPYAFLCVHLMCPKASKSMEGQKVVCIVVLLSDSHDIRTTEKLDMHSLTCRA